MGKKKKKVKKIKEKYTKRGLPGVTLICWFKPKLGSLLGKI